MDNRPNRKRRLVVFGCSFTDWYPWPTWADYLSYFYNRYENHAWGGLGNRQIVTSVFEFLRNDNVGLHDTDIIIQWSSFQRECRMVLGDKTIWTPMGSPYSSILYPSDFKRDILSLYQNVYESVNYISGVTQLLNSLGVRNITTYMLDPSIDLCFGEPGFCADHYVGPDIIKKCKEKVLELKNIDNIVTTKKCMTMNQLDYPEYSKVSKYTAERVPELETHPSPMHGYLFILKHIQPLLPEIQIENYPELFKVAQNWQQYAEDINLGRMPDEPDTHITNVIAKRHMDGTGRRFVKIHENIIGNE